MIVMMMKMLHYHLIKMTMRMMNMEKKILVISMTVKMAKKSLKIALKNDMVKSE